MSIWVKFRSRIPQPIKPNLVYSAAVIGNKSIWLQFRSRIPPPFKQKFGLFRCGDRAEDYLFAVPRPNPAADYTQIGLFGCCDWE